MQNNDRSFDDIGELLPNARKHQYASGEQKDLKLRDIWPEPNWIELADSGVDLEVCAYIYAVYRGLRRTPRSADEFASAEQWEAAFLKNILIVKDLLLEAEQPDELYGIDKRFIQIMGIESFDDIVLDDHYYLFACGRGESRTYKMPFSLTKLSRNYKKWLPELGWPWDFKGNQLKCFPGQLTTGSWVLTSVKGKSFRLADDVRYATVEECKAAALKTIELRQKPINPRKDLSQIPTIQPGQLPVDPKLVLTEFRCRGLQYGNWMSSKVRERFVINTYVSLKLLAKILNLPDSWLGLGGLGVAFGARGLAGASAHYEPDLHIINLTKNGGPGSLAHEWFHALDATMARAIGLNGKLLSMTRFSVNLASDPANIKRLKAFKELIKAVTRKDTDFYACAANIASQSGARNYWTTKSELLARAFEAYIEDKLNELDIPKVTMWLSFGTTIVPQEKMDFNPYPAGDERRLFNDAFDVALPALFEV